MMIVFRANLIRNKHDNNILDGILVETLQARNEIVL